VVDILQTNPSSIWNSGASRYNLKLPLSRLIHSAPVCQLSTYYFCISSGAWR